MYIQNTEQRDISLFLFCRKTNKGIKKKKKCITTIIILDL